MTVTEASAGPRPGRVLLPLAWAAALPTAVVVGLRLLEWRREGDSAYVASDITGVTVVGVVALLAVGALAVWGLRGGPLRQRRLTVGLAVAAVVALPLFWWSALPVVLAVSVLSLTSVLGRERSSRPAVVTAWVVVTATVALWVGSTLAAVL